MQKGFTLIELLITVLVIGILSSIAVGQYDSYVKKQRIVEAQLALATFGASMQQIYADNRTYANGSVCAATYPTLTYFTFACATSNLGANYLATITNKATLDVANNYIFTLDDSFVKATVNFDGRTSVSDWLTK